MATKYIVKGYYGKWFALKGKGYRSDPASAHPYSEDELRHNWNFWWRYRRRTHPTFKPTLRQVRDS